jgi:ketosteroid isomerase-like protein
MKRRFSAVGVLFVAVLAGIFCISGCANEGYQSSEDAGLEQSLRRASAEWDVLFNARAGARLAMLYAQDGYTMPPGGATLTGRAALRKDFESLFDVYNARHETNIDEYIIEGNRAIELAHYTLTLQPRTEGEQVVETGRRVMCRRQTATGWEILWEIWNTDGTPQK